MRTKTNKKTGGQILVECLIKHSTERVFCVPGESYLGALDAFYDFRKKIKLVNAKHEASASNMAEAYGKLTGNPGIAFVTRGPGACHASVGIHISKQDSSPMILFVGQVSNSMFGKEAFQEIDYVSMFSNVAKKSFHISNVEDIEKVTHKAFQISKTDRKGPVVISLPEDILIKTTFQKKLKVHKIKEKKINDNKILKMKSLIENSKKPIIILGGSNWSENSKKNIEKFAKIYQLPVVTSFRRQDLINNRSKNFVGTLGTSVSPKLLDFFKESDLVLAIGTRLNDISTNGFDLFSKSQKQTKLIHIYPSHKEIKKVFKATLSIETSINNFSNNILNLDESYKKKFGNWLKKLRREYIDDITLKENFVHHKLAVICKKINNYINQDTVITLDAGNHTGWPQRYIQYNSKCIQIGSTCGSMGYSIPAAISSSFVYPKKKIISFVGDGGFLMSGLEISTAVENKLNIIFIIINNSSYGTIRMHQEKYYPKRVIGTNLKNPDFVSICNGMGANAKRVKNVEDFFHFFKKCFNSKKVSVIELITDIENISTRLLLSKIKK